MVGETFAICLGSFVILLWNVMELLCVVGGALLDRPCMVFNRMCVLCLQSQNNGITFNGITLLSFFTVNFFLAQLIKLHLYFKITTHCKILSNNTHDLHNYVKLTMWIYHKNTVNNINPISV